MPYTSTAAYNYYRETAKGSGVTRFWDRMEKNGSVMGGTFISTSPPPPPPPYTPALKYYIARNSQYLALRLY